MLKIKTDLNEKNSLPNSPETLNAPFVQVLLEIIEDQRISAGAFRLYTLLIAISRGFGACWPSQPTLASRLGVSQRTIRNWLKELEVLGLIEIEHRYTAPGQEQSNLYRLKKLVLRQAERGRQENTTPTGNTVPPTPEKSCQAGWKNFAAYIHEEELHDKENINTHDANSPCQETEALQGVCAILDEVKSSGEKQEPATNLQEQPQSDTSQLTLRLIEQHLKRAGVSAKRIKPTARLVVQNGRTARYVETWLSWIGRQAYIHNPAAYLLSRIEENTDVPRPHVQFTPARSAFSSWTGSNLDLAAGTAPESSGSSMVSDERVAPETTTEEAQLSSGCTTGKLHLVVDNTKPKSSLQCANDDWPGLRLVIDNTLPPDELLALELVNPEREQNELAAEDRARASKSVPVPPTPDTALVNATAHSHSAPSAIQNLIIVDMRLKELMVQRDPRMRRVKRLEVLGDTLYVAFWSKVDTEMGVGASWLADTKFLYPIVTTITLL